MGKKSISSTIKVKGMFRIKLGETKDGALNVIGDSGWCENQVVIDGFDQYIVRSIGAIAGSKVVSHMAIGSGAAPASNGTALPSELTGGAYVRKTTANTTVASKTLQCTAAWGSSDHPGGTPTISTLGLYNTLTAGTILCGNTFNSSAWNSNQAISATYQLQFS